MTVIQPTIEVAPGITIPIGPPTTVPVGPAPAPPPPGAPEPAAAAVIGAGTGRAAISPRPLAADLALRR